MGGCKMANPSVSIFPHGARLYEWPVDCWFNGVWRACKMIDAVPPPALPGAHVSSCNVVYSVRHCPKKHTMLTAVAAALLRWLNKNTGSGGGRLVAWLGTLNSTLARLVFWGFLSEWMQHLKMPWSHSSGKERNIGHQMAKEQKQRWKRKQHHGKHLTTNVETITVNNKSHFDRYS